MRRVILAVFGTIAGLVGLLSFKTHPQSIAAPPAAISTTAPGSLAAATAGTSTARSGSPKGGAGSSTTTSGANAGTASTSTKAKTPSTARATSTKTITGSSVDTRYGPVQVRIVVTNGKLTGVAAVDYPASSGRDQQINAEAIPALNQEVLAAGNAKVDMVSGATYTSQGYLDSLQSALDKVGL